MMKLMKMCSRANHASFSVTAWLNDVTASFALCFVPDGLGHVAQADEALETEALFAGESA